MVLLGIDYGEKRLGLALARAGWARPEEVLINDARVWQKIKRLCQKQGAEKIIVGLPEGRLVGEVEKFGRKLEKALSLPVVFQDETLTTKNGLAKMVEAGKKKKVRQERKDAFAAALILADYIEKTESAA